MMTDKQFREQVRRMRAAQKEYFQYRLKSSLDYSRKLEREVDAELRKSEPALFPEAEPWRPTQRDIDLLNKAVNGGQLESYEWERLETLYQGLRSLVVKPEQR